MRSFYILTILLAFDLIIPLASYGVHDEVGSFHCLECHVRIPFKGVPLSYSKELPNTCIRCHGNYHKGIGFLHPIGMKPMSPIPKDLLLGPNGEITCTTCHIFHPKDSPTQNGTPTFLRRSSAKKLCIACHGEGLMKSGQNSSF